MSRPVVAYCYAGPRASSAVAVLRDAGFSDARNGLGWVEPAGNAATLEALCDCSADDASPCPDAPYSLGVRNSPTRPLGGSLAWVASAALLLLGRA